MDRSRVPSVITEEHCENWLKTSIQELKGQLAIYEGMLEYVQAYKREFPSQRFAVGTRLAAPGLRAPIPEEGPQLPSAPYYTRRDTRPPQRQPQPSTHGMTLRKMPIRSHPSSQQQANQPQSKASTSAMDWTGSKHR